MSSGGEISGFRILTRPQGSPPVSNRYEPPLEVRRGCWHFFQGEAGQSTLISTSVWENGALLGLWQETQHSSRVGTGIWGNFWSFIKRGKYPFEFQEGTWAFFGNASTYKGLLKRAGDKWFAWSCGGKLMLPLKLCVDLGDLLVSPHGS